MNIKNIFRKGFFALLVGATALVACSKDSDNGKEPVPQGEYDINIGGVEVTSANYQNIAKPTFPAVKRGKITYDPINRVLTLENAIIDGGKDEKALILKPRSGNSLTVKVIGNNKLTARNDVVFIQSSIPVTLTGGGTLKLESSDYKALYISNSMLSSFTIEGCNVNIYGENGAIRGSGNGILFIRNASVTAGCKESDYCISEIAALRMEGCAITQPDGAVFDATLNGVAKDGNLVKGKVVIDPTP